MILIATIHNNHKINTKNINKINMNANIITIIITTNISTVTYLVWLFRKRLLPT